MQKIILYYLFTPIKDAEAIRLWQKNLALSLGLKGRIIIADHGINGTLGGDINHLKDYIKQTKTYDSFKPISFKWTDGQAADFPRLSVKVRSELVTFGLNKKLEVTKDGVVGGGKHISPEQLHELVITKADQLVFVDGRNSREAAIGKFKNAVVMDINHTRDFPAEIVKVDYEDLKQKTVVTYCTGGIRCEVLSKLMKDEGYKDVYQLEGGIVRYLDKYKDDGLWEGSLFVFDDRIRVKASERAKTIGHCDHCQIATDNYQNCSNQACNELILACADCHQRTSTCYNCSLITTKIA